MAAPDVDASSASDEPLISIILPIRNLEQYLEQMLESLLGQTYRGAMELSVFDDGSSDASMKILENFSPILHERGITLMVAHSDSPVPRGCGYGRNIAIQQSHGRFLCFADGDDVMYPKRIELQLRLAMRSNRVLVGANFVREPSGATPRLTAWLNSLSEEQLYLHQLREVTVVTPSWFCARAVFDAVEGGFDESGPGTPDDLIFFYRHLSLGGLLAKVDEPLLMYRFHAASVTGQRGVDWRSIWSVRVAHLQSWLLSHPPWSLGFTIWNAGKEGRRLYRSLTPANQAKVVGFCDVDMLKVERGYEHAETGRHLPVVHFRDAAPPLLLCVKLGLTEGEFEANLASLNLREGIDYVHFS